jgi:hypothetical protein
VVVVLLVLSAVSACVALWSVRRHAAMTAWDRELEAAFGHAERKEISQRRVL